MVRFGKAITIAAAVAASAAMLQTAGATEFNKADAGKIQAYVQSKGLACMSCHGIDNKIVGPAWTDVAKKYKGDPKAEAELTKRIANGGSGIWGATPMPAGMATPAQAKDLAKLILGLDSK